MRILVAGGAGFLGSHLVEALLGRGEQVLVVDNYHTGQTANLVPHLGNPNLEVLRHDITFPIYVEVDGIFNLASPASPVSYQLDPVRTMKTNVIGSTNLLGLAKRLKVRIVQASTSEVYGDPKMHPQSENYWGNVNPIGPRACYDEGKRAAETLYFDYMRQHGVDVGVARIFNTFGPRMAIDDGRVISNFVVQALRGEPVTIQGDGSQTRSFCYVTDLVGGLVSLFDSGLEGPVNLGNPNEMTVGALAELILSLTESESKIVHIPAAADDPVRRQPDITKAKSLLGWSPHISLIDGLKLTIDDFRQRL